MFFSFEFLILPTTRIGSTIVFESFQYPLNPIYDESSIVRGAGKLRRTDLKPKSKKKSCAKRENKTREASLKKAFTKQIQNL